MREREREAPPPFPHPPSPLPTPHPHPALSLMVVISCEMSVLFWVTFLISQFATFWIRQKRTSAQRLLGRCVCVGGWVGVCVCVLAHATFVAFSCQLHDFGYLLAITHCIKIIWSRQLLSCYAAVNARLGGILPSSLCCRCFHGDGLTD